MIVSKLAGDVLFGGRTNNGVHAARAKCSCNLRELRTQTAYACVDKQAIPRGEPGNRGQGEVGCDGVDGNHRGEVDAKPGGDGGDECCRSAGDVSESPGSWQYRGNLLTDVEISDPLPERTYGSANFESGHEAGTGGHGSVDPESIDQTNTGVLDVDADLAGARLGCGKFAEDEPIEGLVVCEDERTHCSPAGRE
ncbi:hypothetical protein GCM10010052_30180 [Paenarthrobacter histidinolovorans]|nr:hypothetical protein GCM10010052_30180 [Paenarthrobacter histidinolovorans]